MIKRIIFILILKSVLLELQGQTCPTSSENVSLYVWTASKGTVANYSANIIDSNKTLGFIIILGRTDRGIFTIEGLVDDNGHRADLAFTSFAGDRKTYKLYGFNRDDEERYYRSDSLAYMMKQDLKNQLWKYPDKKLYNVDSLKPTKYLRNISSDNSLWALRIKDNDLQKALSWRLLASPEMCFCFYTWECTSSNLNN